MRAASLPRLAFFQRLAQRSSIRCVSLPSFGRKNISASSCAIVSRRVHRTISSVDTWTTRESDDNNDNDGSSTIVTSHHNRPNLTYSFRVIQETTYLDEDESSTSSTCTLSDLLVRDRAWFPSISQLKKAVRHGEISIELPSSHHDRHSSHENDDDSLASSSSEQPNIYYLQWFRTRAESPKMNVPLGSVIRRITRIHHHHHHQQDDDDFYTISWTKFVYPPEFMLNLYNEHITRESKMLDDTDEDESERIPRVVWEDDHVGVVWKPANLETMDDDDRNDLESSLPFLLKRPNSSASSTDDDATLNNTKGGDGPSPVKQKSTTKVKKTRSKATMQSRKESKSVITNDQEELSNVFLPRPVHRLDGSMSGLVICAKSLQAYTKLTSMAQNGLLDMTFTALVLATSEEESDTSSQKENDILTTSSGTIDAPIHGKDAVTEWKVLERHHGSSNNSLMDLLVLMQLKSTTKLRYHQIRRHLFYGLHAPILGDTTYGANDAAVLSSEQDRNSTDDDGSSTELFLAVTEVEFKHPIKTFQTIQVSAPTPDSFQKAITKLSQEGGEGSWWL